MMDKEQASDARTPADSGRLSRQAAMFSLAAPFLGIGFNLLATLIGKNNRGILLLGAFATIVLVLAGLVLGILALVSNRKRQAEGVTPRAVGGVCISGFLILMMASGVPGLLRALGKTDGRNQPQSVERQGPGR